MKTKLLGKATNYNVSLTQTESLPPIRYIIRQLPFDLQDYMTVAQARHLANDLNAIADVVERMENE